MKKQLVASLFIILVPFIFVSCVSTLLKEKAPTFSDEITFSEPEKPFLRQSTAVFPAWKSQQNGNVLTIVSDCQSGSATGLSGLHRLIENSLEKVSVLEEVSQEFQGKPALRRTVQAELDGHKIELFSISFKRLNCGYVSSLSGKTGTLESDKKIFEQFINGFKFR